MLDLALSRARHIEESRAALKRLEALHSEQLQAIAASGPERGDIPASLLLAVLSTSTELEE